MANTSYLVVEIRDVGNRRKFIHVNEESASFQLYNTELAKYGIEEGGYISGETYDAIRSMLINRARERSLHIVTRQDITEAMLRSKLEAGGYSRDIIDMTVCFMKEQKFINDERYAVNYVWCKADTRSRRQMENYLYGKGIDRDIIDRACDDYYTSNEDAEEALIKKLIEKKHVDTASMTYEDRAKLMAYLVRKGFGFDKVNKVLDDVKRQK